MDIIHEHFGVIGHGGFNEIFHWSKIMPADETGKISDSKNIKMQIN